MALMALGEVLARNTIPQCSTLGITGGWYQVLNRLGSQDGSHIETSGFRQIPEHKLRFIPLHLKTDLLAYLNLVNTL